MSKEAMKLALEALKSINEMVDYEGNGFKLEYEIKALEEALAEKQEQGEPVAFDVWLQECESMTMAVRHGVQFLLMPEESAVRIGTAIQNTTPQQRKPLTKQQRIEIIESLEFENSQQELIDAVEAAHNIKDLQKKREFVGLTEPEVDECYESIMFHSDIEPSRMGVYLEIEAKLKEKNT